MEENQPKENIKFKGWVPTVSGRLSLSVFGQTKEPTPAITANAADAEWRYIVCYQKRILLDTPLPFKTAVSKLWGESGKFWFTCIGKASDNPAVENERLTGHLFLFHSRTAWRTNAEELVKNSQNILREFNDEDLSTSIEEYYQKEFDQLIDELTKIASFRLVFSLERTGELLLEVPDLTHGLISSPSFPKDHSERLHMFHVVSSQLFFFLRDIGHTHQHHHPSTDTIVDIYPFDGKDDFTWRCQTQRALFRKVLEFKRLKQEDICNSSLGVLAYANAFKIISEKSSRRDASGVDRETIEPDLDTESLTASIRANQTKLHNSNQNKIQRSESARNIGLTIFAILLSLVGLLQIVSPVKDVAVPSGNLVALANFLLEFPLYAFGATVLLISVYLHTKRLVDLANWGLNRFILRMLQVFSKKTTAIIILVLSIVLILATILFSHSYAESESPIIVVMQFLSPLVEKIAEYFQAVSHK